MAPINVLWLIDHVCYDGSLHGGGRLFMNLAPMFDPAEVKIFPYFLRANFWSRAPLSTSPMYMSPAESVQMVCGPQNLPGSLLRRRLGWLLRRRLFGYRLGRRLL